MLEHAAPTFSVRRRHYALVIIEGLEAATTIEYEVHLDGERARPEVGSDLPPSVIGELTIVVIDSRNGRLSTRTTAGWSPKRNGSGSASRPWTVRSGADT